MSLSLVIIRGNHLTLSCSEGSVQRPVCMNIDRWAQRCWFCARSRRCAADASVCTRVAIKTSTSEGESPPPLYLRTWQCTVCRSVMQLTPRPTSFVQPVTSATWAIAVSCPLFTFTAAVRLQSALLRCSNLISPLSICDDSYSHSI